MVALRRDLRGRRDFVFGSMDAEHAMHLNRGGSGCGNFSFYAVGAEPDLRIARAFENVLMPLPVATTVAALPAGRIEHNLTADLLRCRVEMNLAALQREASLDGMQRIAQSEIRRGLCRVALENDFLCAGANHPGQRA